MPKKGAKATKKFAKSGGLKQTIDARRKHQKMKKQIQARKSVRGAPIVRDENAGEGDDAGDDHISDGPRKGKGAAKGKGRAKAVDFLDPEEDDGDSEGAVDQPVSSKGK